MNFSFSEDQDVLREFAQRFCVEHFDNDGHGPGADTLSAADELWAQIAAMGWIGLDIPESLGGGGGSLTDSCIVAEVFAEHLAPIGFGGSAVIVPAALQMGGHHSDLASAIEGRPYALAVGSDLQWPYEAGSRLRLWEARPDAQAVVLGESGLDLSEVEVTGSVTTADLLRSIPWVEGAGPAAVAIDPDARDRLLAVALTVVAASLVGTMAGALKTTLAHVQAREQFGKPIGAFQAVQHMCAEMLVDLESSRSAAYGASWACDEASVAEALQMAATAKLWCSEAALRVCETAVQAHGGIGYTWEASPHLYLRQAQIGAHAFAHSRELDRLVTSALTAA